MPDRSTAATEHSLIQEITEPLAKLPDDPLPEVTEVSFPLTLRGYDRLAVDAYVRKTSQLVAELQATRSPEAAVRRALARVGEEVSGILQRAHETAEEITVQSRSEAEERLEAARREAAEITSGADKRLAELDSETDRIWSERQRIVEDVRDLAQSLLVLADAAVDRFPAAPEETGEADKAEEPAAPLDRWQNELDHWEDDEEGEADVEATEATTAMPPVEPEEAPEPAEPHDPVAGEETRKQD